MSHPVRNEKGAEFRCSVAAVWLPRVLGASLLASATVAGLHLDPNLQVPFSGPVRVIIVLAGAAGALWLVRGGSDVRLRFGVNETAIAISVWRRSVRLPFADVDGLDYEPAFGSRRRWLPAVVLVGRHRRRWRIPALVGDGTHLLTRILDACDRDDLRSWSDARRLGPRMMRSRLIVPVGYASALALICATWYFFYR
jgi:hypothetical protein